jgi:hypothetical protein
MYAARSFDLPVQQMLVRGVCFYKDKIAFAEATMSCKPYLLDRWYEQVVKDYKKMVQSYLDDEWDYDFDFACQRGCPYPDLCTSANEERWQKLNFEEQPNRWNPLQVI